MSTTRFSVESVFKAVDKVTAPVSKMQNKIGRFTQSMTRGLKQVDAAMQGVSSGAKRTLAVIAVGLVAVSAALMNIIDTGAEFEQTMVNAAVKFPGEIRQGTKAFEELEQAALKTGASTEFSASQAAGGLEFLARAGFDAEQAMAALPKTVDFATASGLDLAMATDIATDTLGAFGLASDDAAQRAKNLDRVMDVITRTANSTNTNVEELFEVVKAAGPITKAAGQDIESFSTILGFMASNSIKASVGGTAVKNLMTRLAAPTGDAAKLLDRFGVSLDDGKGGAKDILTILPQLEKGLSKLGKIERVAAIKEIFGKNSISGAEVILSAPIEKLREMRKELRGLEGETAKVAGVMRGTLGNQMKVLTSTIEGVKLEMFEVVKGPFAQLVSKTTQWFNANKKIISSGFAKVVEFVADNFVFLAKTLGLVVGFSSALIALTSIITTVTAVVWLFNVALAANPIYLTVAAILAIIAVVVVLATYWTELTAKFDSFSTTIKIVIVGLMWLVSGPLTLLVFAIKAVVDNWDMLRDGVLAGWGVIKAVFTEMKNTVSPIFDGIISKVSEMASKIVEALGGKVLRAALKSFVTFFSPIVDTLKMFVDTIKEIPGVVSQNVEEFAQPFFDAEALPDGGGPGMVTPQSRAADAIQERTTTNTSKVLIQAAEGTKAEMVEGGKDSGVTLENFNSDEVG